MLLTFTYDGVGQMLIEQRSNYMSGVNYTHTFAYGARGNFGTRKSENGAVSNTEPVQPVAQ